MVLIDGDWSALRYGAWLWTSCITFALIGGFQEALRDPWTMLMATVMPVDSQELYRWQVTGWAKRALLVVWDWLWIYGFQASGSELPQMLGGALVQGLVAGAIAVVLVIGLPWLPWKVISLLPVGGGVAFVIIGGFNDRLQHWLKDGFWRVMEHSPAAVLSRWMEGGGAGWPGAAGAGLLAGLGIAGALWVSGRRFSIPTLDDPDEFSQEVEAPSEGLVEKSRGQPPFEAALREWDGSAFAARGRLERCFCGWLKPELRKHLDFAMPRGWSWSRRWLVGAAWSAVAVGCFVMRWEEAALVLAILAYGLAVPLQGGAWVGLCSARVGTSAAIYSAMLPVSLPHLAWAVVLANGFQVMLGAPVIGAAAWVMTEGEAVGKLWTLGLVIGLSLQMVWVFFKISSSTRPLVWHWWGLMWRVVQGCASVLLIVAAGLLWMKGEPVELRALGLGLIPAFSAFLLVRCLARISNGRVDPMGNPA
ncbi:hypothetical protein [Haloferula sargassicola]